MEKNNQIVMLSVDSLREHPDNPRKDLGDLEELSNSIKENGVFQNLTVVPTEETGGSVEDKPYTIIIGHRRTAAAKKAGVKELPCVIAHMSKEEQLSTMLSENLQRNDLTLYEQARTFAQLKFDFGISDSEIAKKSGFSKSTIKSRLEIAKLDGKKIKKAESAGIQIRLEDFKKLEKIESVETRNELLGEIGGYNFDWKLKRAEDSEQSERLLKILMPVLSTFAVKDDGFYHNSGSDYAIVKNKSEAVGFTAPSADELKDNKFTYSTAGGNVYVYKEPKTIKIEKSEEEEKEKKEKKIRAKQAECKKNLKELFKTAWILRYNFIFENALNIYDRLDEFVVKCILCGEKSINLNAFEVGIGEFEVDEEYNRYSFSCEGIANYFESTAPGKVSTVLAVYGFADDCGADNICYDCYGQYNPYDGESLKRLYGMLEEFGYKTSADETALADGTHSAYYRADG